ncbi:MAG: PEP-CTERM sorting domain-containing protein [Gammaproteobacteria bacterium]|nr:PEP-CTERM sorting domain-containing protein [Gammaproteobacteria bacterium]
MLGGPGYADPPGRSRGPSGKPPTLHYGGAVNERTWRGHWRIKADPHAVIDTTISFTNRTASLRTFDVAMTSPVSPQFNLAFLGGRLSATARDSGDGILRLLDVDWWGTINRTTALTLLAADIDVNAGSGVNADLAPVSDGFPGPSLFHDAGGPINEIGTRLTFALSPGDNVAFDTRFEVVPVPAPTSLGLFALGALVLLAVRRCNGRRSGRTRSL